MRREARDAAWYAAYEAARHARIHAYYVANRERVLSRAKAKREADPEKFRIRAAKSRQKRRKMQAPCPRPSSPRSSWELAQRREYEQRRRIDKLTGGRPVGLSVRAQITYLDLLTGGKCFYCGAEDGRAIDHVVPINKGGPHLLENIVPACTSCNSTKNAKWPSEFVAFRAQVGEPLQPHVVEHLLHTEHRFAEGRLLTCSSS